MEKIKLSYENIKVNSISELNKISIEKNWDEWGFNKAVMKPEFNTLDICWVGIFEILISERLKDAIENAQLTGISIKECPLNFEISNDPGNS